MRLEYGRHFYFMIGIYKITSPSKKIYIGQSIDIEKRFNEYKRLSCKGQIKLYSSLKKYGFEKHKFEVLLECSSDELNEFERYYQDLYCATNRNGLNLKLTKTNDRKCEHSEETKLKISINKKQGYKNRGHIKKVKKWKDNKVVLDLNTGVYYTSISDCAKYSLFKFRTTKRMLYGLIINKTSCIVV